LQMAVGKGIFSIKPTYQRTGLVTTIRLYALEKS
jgi:hypothetical protein